MTDVTDNPNLLTRFFLIEPTPLQLGAPGANSTLFAQVFLTAPFNNATPAVNTVFITIKYRKNNVTTTQLFNTAMIAGTSTPPNFPYSYSNNAFNVVAGATYWYEVTCQWNIPYSEKATSTPTNTP